MQLLALLKKLRERPEQDSNPGLCDGSAVLYQLNYPVNWELVLRWVDNKPVDDRYISKCMMWVHEIHVFEL